MTNLKTFDLNEAPAELRSSMTRYGQMCSVNGGDKLC